MTLSTLFHKLDYESKLSVNLITQEQIFQTQHLQQEIIDNTEPFPALKKSAADDFEYINFNTRVCLNESILLKVQLKTLRHHMKLLIMNNFFFCHIVFKRCLLQMSKNTSANGKGLMKYLLF